MKTLTLNVVAVAITLLAGVACSKKIAVTAPKQVQPSVSPATPVETRKMLGMVSFLLPLEKELREKDYKFGKYYAYAIEEGGKQYVEFTGSPILFSNNQHQLAPTSKVVAKMEIKIDHKKSSAVKDNEPQIQEVGELVFEGIVRGTYRAWTSGFVIESLCAEKLSYCKIEKADATQTFTAKTFTFDRLSPRFAKACAKNNNFSGFCSLITQVETQVDTTLANLGSTRTLVAAINAFTRGGFRTKLAEVDGWIKTVEASPVKINAIKEKTISAIESGKSLFDASYAQMETELKAMSEEAIRINNFRANMKRQIVFEALEKELAKIEKKRELIELYGKKSEELFKSALKLAPTSNEIKAVLHKLDQSFKVIIKWKAEVSNISSEIYKDTIKYEDAKVRVASLMAALSNEARTISVTTREGNQMLGNVLRERSGAYLIPLMDIHHELNSISSSLK